MALAPMQFVVHAPLYVRQSAGCRALWQLASELRARGHDVAISPFVASHLESTDSPEDFDLVPQNAFRDAIHVLPEVIPGNPAYPARVVRWYLNSPRFGDVDPTEHAVAWSTRRPGCQGMHRLRVDVIEAGLFFNPDPVGPSRRPGPGLRFLGKGNPLTDWPVELASEWIDVTAAWPASRAEMAEVLRQASVLVTPDDFSMIHLEGAVSGCPVLVTEGKPDPFWGVAAGLGELEAARRDVAYAEMRYAERRAIMATEIDALCERLAGVGMAR